MPMQRCFSTNLQIFPSTLIGFKVWPEVVAFSFTQILVDESEAIATTLWYTQLPNTTTCSWNAIATIAHIHAQPSLGAVQGPDHRSDVELSRKTNR